jgi:hypothetical protein
VIVCLSQNKRYFLVFHLQKPKQPPTEIAFPGHKLPNKNESEEKKMEDKNLNQIKIVLTHNCINFIETVKQGAFYVYVTYSYKKKEITGTATPRIQNFEWIHSMEMEVRENKAIPKKEGKKKKFLFVSFFFLNSFFFFQILFPTETSSSALTRT